MGAWWGVVRCSTGDRRLRVVLSSGNALRLKVAKVSPEQATTNNNKKSNIKNNTNNNKNYTANQSAFQNVPAWFE